MEQLEKEARVMFREEKVEESLKEFLDVLDDSKVFEKNPEEERG